jgi:hypothetical protein
MTKLPKILPPSMKLLHCYNHDYLYVPKDVAERFEHCRATTNYPKIMNSFKSILRARNRVTRLEFCIGLQDGIDEFRYRPSNSGYSELRKKYDGIFL